MPKYDNDYEVFYIPPNFMESGTVLGGTLKLRNAAEAVILGLAVGLPVLRLSISLTARIILLCLTVLPLMLAAVIGVGGESLSAFALSFIQFLRRRRVVGAAEQSKSSPLARLKREDGAYSEDDSWDDYDKARERSARNQRDEDEADEFEEPKPKREKRKPKKKKREPVPVEEDEEFDDLMSYSTKVPRTERQPRRERKPARLPFSLSRPTRDEGSPPKEGRALVAEYLPVERIVEGVVCTRDHRYVKILELNPVNFTLRNEDEKRNIIYAYASFLKISPVKLLIKVLSKRADVNRHLDSVRAAIDREDNEACRMLQRDMAEFLGRIGSREGVSRRFFLIFEYEPVTGRRENDESEALAQLRSVTQTVRNYLRHCGNDVIEQEDENEFAASVFYSLLYRKESSTVPFAAHAKGVILEKAEECGVALEQALETMPIAELFAPEEIDFTHGKYVEMGGVFYSFLLVPSRGYRPKVMAGWLSTLVNAGEGIDLDLFLTRQPKDRVTRKLGQQLRINRSKIKDASDTNSDFDDLEDAIQGGYFLKEGIANNEDFYFMNLLITVTASSPEDLEWRVSELKKLLVSQDMDLRPCNFRMEQAFLSSLPLCELDKGLFERSKRNLLTSSAASAYPFTSFEVCNDEGILLGINKYNSSLVIADIYNTELYKNANIVLLGATGAGKTFASQLIALRLREQGTQVFAIVPLKGHEYHRACTKVGGTYVQISPASPNCINIMEIRKVDRSTSVLLDGETTRRSELAMKIQSLHVFFSLLIPDMSYEDRQLLDEALVKTYDRKGITHDNASLEDPTHPGKYKEMPILGDLYETLLEVPEARRIATILNRLVNGSAKTFNQQTNIDLDNKYVVLDISEITGDLLPVGMYVALDYVWDKTKEDRTVKKAILLDEVWRLIGTGSNREAAEQVLEIFKTVRGYGGAAIAATQDVSDFLALEDGKYGKGIISAAQTKMVLNMEIDEARRLQPILHLSDTEVMEITHFDRGDALLSTKNNNLSVEFRASDLEHSLITTDRRELEVLVEWERQRQSEQGSELSEPEEL